MRKQQSDSIRELMNSMPLAHKQIGDLLTIVPVEEIVKLLEQCQQCAITIGNIIEKEPSGCKKSVAKLEEYCESVYAISERIKKNERIDAKCLQDELNVLISEVDHCMMQEITIHLEVVFMPYKMEMWDCMKSVWEAACENPYCDAYVVPLPYCTRKLNREMGEFHTEKELFQNAGIAALSIDEYDITERKPDICFIHNPYDDNNFVTSVHPFFYSENLKKYVHTLVYIPYFFTGAQMPDIHLRERSYKNMDYIVLPGKLAVKQMAKYVDSEKLLPLGSPKTDQVQVMDDSIVPSEWKRMIRGRKAVLYNLGIGSLLDGGNRTLEKMRYIFNVFKEREDAVLIWRPHPLIQNTLQSMNPELLYAYKELVREFQYEHIGIYDTLPDTAPSLFAADAFIGDYSSLVNMFGVMGKPVFYTNNTTMALPKESDNQINASEILFEKYDVPSSTFYFMSHTYNVFGTFDEEGRVKVLSQIGDNFSGYAQYNFCPDWDNEEIYFTPTGNNDSIIVADLQGNEKTRIKIEEPAAVNNLMWMYPHKELRFFIPGNRCAIGIYNTKTKKMFFDERIKNQLNPLKRYPSEMFFRWAHKVGNKLFFLCYRAGAIMEYDLDSLDYVFYKVGNGEEVFSNFNYDGGTKFYLLEWNGTKIVSWDIHTHEEVVYDQFPDAFRAMDSIYVSEFTPAFQVCVPIRNNVYVFPFLANMILKIDIQTGKIEEADFDIPYIQGQRKSSLYNDASNFGPVLRYGENKIIAKSSYDNSIFLLDVSKNTHKRIYLKRTADIDEEIDRNQEKWLTQNNIDPLLYFNEDGINNTIDDFLNMLTSETWNPDIQMDAYKKSENIANVDGGCGKAVLQALIEKELRL